MKFEEFIGWQSVDEKGKSPIDREAKNGTVVCSLGGVWGRENEKTRLEEGKEKSRLKGHTWS